MSSPKTLAVKLTHNAEKIVKRGHPWVFSDSIVKISKDGAAGDLAILFDRRTDKIYAVGLYDPESAVRIKIIHTGGGAKINKEFFREKIEASYTIRKPLLETDTDAYRLLFGENDGFPGLIADVYAGKTVVKVYSAVWFPYLKEIGECISEITGSNGVMLRLSRNLQREDTPFKEAEIILGEIENPEVEFKEYGVRFKTNLELGHKTGFFLDHRENRHKVGEMAEGKTVLDVFSYAGGFSVHALAGGAKEVISLDFSRQALELAKENAALNPHSGKHKVLVGDAFVLLGEFIKKKQKFAIVIIDPPSFAKSAEEREVALKKYAELAELGVKLTRKDGLLLLASCSSRIKEEEFFEVHREVFQRMNVNYRLEETTAHAVDHPVTFEEGAYLKSAYYRILS